VIPDPLLTRDTVASASWTTTVPASRSQGAPPRVVGEDGEEVDDEPRTHYGDAGRHPRESEQ
jgi:hypothetical protein